MRCKVCDSSRNYYRYVRNITHVMCAYFSLYNPMTKTGSRLCTIRTEHYPFDKQIQVYSMNISRGYQKARPYIHTVQRDDGSGTEQVCFDNDIFFTIVGRWGTLNQASDMSCQNYYYAESAPQETALLTIFNFLEQNILCYSCTYDKYTTETIQKISGVELYVGGCLYEGNQCKYYQYYDPMYNKCKSCSDLFSNCASCNTTTCSLCLDGYYLHPSVYDYATKSYRPMCIFNLCPEGTCKNTVTQKCELVALSDCLTCETMENDVDYTTPWYTCTNCKKGYTLYDERVLVQSTPSMNSYVYRDFGRCKLESVANLYGKEYATNITYNIYFQSSAGASDLSRDWLNMGFTPQDASRNLMTTMPLISFLTKPSSSSKKQVVNVYVGKGDHFMMLCNFKAMEMSDTLEWNGPCYSGYYDSFLIDTEQAEYSPLNDNLMVVVQAMECRLKDEIIANQQYDEFDTAAFELLCVTLSDTADNRPVIYINDPAAQFNITGNWTFRNLKFSGINQLAVPQKKGQNLSGINKILCTSKGIKTYGAQQSLDLSETTDQFSYRCEDRYYEGQYIPWYNDTYCGSEDYYDGKSYQKFEQKKQSTLACTGGIDDSDHFNFVPQFQSYAYRKKTLFNLFAFADYASSKKVTPQLHIQNCSFEYFLSNYESLINIQTETFTKITGNVLVYTGGRQDEYGQVVEDGSDFERQARDFYLSNGQDRGAFIVIEDSVFQLSRFCKGMIIYRAGYYESTMRTITNLTHVFLTDPSKTDIFSKIVLKRSYFRNLNAFSYFDAFAAYKGINPFTKISSNVITPFSMPAFIHKGIVLNIEDFGGQVEITDCTFEKNQHFTSKMWYRFRSDIATENRGTFLDSALSNEQKLKYCDWLTGSEKYFFNIGFSQEDDIESFYDEFERLSVIYISRNKAPMIFTNNVFSGNIGTFGGAVSINSPNFQAAYDLAPVIVFKNNEFYQNMAFFSGNAVYIRSTLNKVKLIEQYCGGVLIQDNILKKNIGTKIHNGGAITLICEYLTDTSIDDYLRTSGIGKELTSSSISSKANVNTKFSINIKGVSIMGNDFQENYSGLKGSALYIKKFSQISIYDNNFFQNGPVYSSIERKYSPFSERINSQPYTYRHETCADEMQYLQNCDNSETDYLLLPRVRGAIYIEHCQEDTCLNIADGSFPQSLEIKNSVFKQNDVGPAFDVLYAETDIEPLASQIFIKGGLSNIIENCQFVSNTGQTSQYFSSYSESISLINFFPEQYFNSQIASLVVITLEPKITQGFKTMQTILESNRFYSNKHMQVVGISTSSQYKGSLIRFINNDERNMRFLPIIEI
ncbi:hypothetical protein FGO68_gene12535 [Halteria grandinella]|uniref:Uncharacterized protein n=1 Tax=Halteria grandinella TaxID=5974 RepID=A0A8J8SXY0_HALGN|nr:hypothetical protein FGO68_gene12535 [Halteria grandinella]